MENPYQGMLSFLRELVGSPDAETLLRLALVGALRLIPGMEAGSVLLRDGENYRFVALANHEIMPPSYDLSLGDALRWYGGNLEQALGAVPRLNPVDPELSGLSQLDKTTLRDIRWVLAIPVPFQGKIEAWLYLDRWKSSPPPKRVLPLAQELARSLGVALQALRERERTQLRLLREERLARALGVLSAFQVAPALWQALPQLLLDVMGASRAAALQLEGNELVIVAGVNWREPLGRRIPEGKGMSWEAARTGQVLMAHHDDPRVLNSPRFENKPGTPVSPRSGVQYETYVPIFDADGAVLGVMNAYSPLPYSPEDRSLLEAFGHGVGQALGRLEAQAAQARELSRLQDLSNAGRTLDPDVVGELLSLLGTPADPRRVKRR